MQPCADVRKAGQDILTGQTRIVTENVTLSSNVPPAEPAPQRAGRGPSWPAGWVHRHTAGISCRHRRCARGAATSGRQGGPDWRTGTRDTSCILRTLCGAEVADAERAVRSVEAKQRGTAEGRWIGEPWSFPRDPLKMYLSAWSGRMLAPLQYPECGVAPGPRHAPCP
jgi:hypothetical protein